MKWKEMSNNAMSNETDLDWLARNVHVWPVNAKFAVRPGMGEVLFYEHHYSHLVQFSREQVEARRAELQNKPSWETHEYKVIAQGRNGSWYGSNYSEEKFGHESSFCITGTGWNCICRGVDLGDWRDTLEKRPYDLSEQMVMSRLQEATDNVLAAAPELMTDKYKFEPFVSVEDAATAKQPSITPSKYTKTIHGVSVDVYDVLQAWGVGNPALQHLIKKALQCGQRGHKGSEQDLQDIIDSAIRAKELG